MKWQGPNVNTTKAPGSRKGKQPVGKICSGWSDTAAVIPSKSVLGFSWNNKVSKERREKSRLAAMGTDWADLADTRPGNKVNSMLRILGRVLRVSSEQRLTMGFMATVRGRLEKGQQQVSERSALIPDLPLYKLAKPWFSIEFFWPLNSSGIEFYEWGWGVGGWGQLVMAELRFCAIALGEASKKVMADQHYSSSNPASRITHVNQVSGRRSLLK